MRLLGLDVGARTIGLAIGDDDDRVATPLRTLQRAGGQQDVDAVRRVMDEVDATGLVVGLPLTMEGGEGAAARRVRATVPLVLSVPVPASRKRPGAARRAAATSSTFSDSSRPVGSPFEPRTRKPERPTPSRDPRLASKAARSRDPSRRKGVTSGGTTPLSGTFVS